MLKRFGIIFAGLIFACGISSAQNVSAVTVEFSKDAMRPAFSMQLDCSKKVAEEALKKRLKKDRIKGKSSGSMMLYKKVSNKDLGVTNCNLYTKVEGMGRKCNLYFFLERENGNFITAGDPEEGSIMKYMESLTKDVEALQHKNKVNDQKKAYEKAEKKYQKLVKQQNKLEKKVEKADKARQEEKAALEELQKQEK